MNRRTALFAALLLAIAGTLLPGTGPAAGQEPGRAYVPPPGEGWERRRAEQVGMDPGRLAEAVEYARTHESDHPRDFSNQETVFGRRLGPLPKERGGTNGLIIRHGYIVGEWGDTRKVEPTYSAAKSYLSTVLGVAVDRRLIRSVDDPVRAYVQDGGYESPQNRSVTWRHHVTQTSEWEGSLWGKSHDFLGSFEFGSGRMQPRALRAPGSHYEYNDVRVNRLALSLLRLFRRPLPEVLKEAVMDPIGVSDTWQWHGYYNSDVEIDNRTMKSVTGGTRWGGGLWIHSRDQARFGLLFAREGRWGDRQVLSPAWVREATTPSEVRPDYGFLWWLNSEGTQWPSAPRSSFAAVGFGPNLVWVDPADDLVVVWRWHGPADELIKRILAAIRSR